MAKRKKWASESVEPPRAELTHLFADLPAREGQVQFEFAGFATTLAELALNPANETPFTVVVKGEWGRGKTTLLRTTEGVLVKRGAKKASSSVGLSPGEDRVAQRMEVSAERHDPGGSAWRTDPTDAERGPRRSDHRVRRAAQGRTGGFLARSEPGCPAGRRCPRRSRSTGMPASSGTARSTTSSEGSSRSSRTPGSTTRSATTSGSRSRGVRSTIWSPCSWMTWTAVRSGASARRSRRSRSLPTCPASASTSASTGSG